MINEKCKKILKVVAAPIALSAFLVGCSGTDESRTVATVGDVDITEAELNKLMTSQYGQSVLDTLIVNKIVEQEAKKLEIDVTKEEIDEEYATYAESYGGEDALLEAIKTYNMTEDDIRSDVRMYLLTLKVMEDYVEITDEDIKAYFEENIDKFGSPEQVEASHILVKDEATAKEVLEKINAGKDFAALAKEYSTDEASAEKGGELGLFGRGDMVAEFEEAAFGMKIGDVTPKAVKTEHGYHIIKVTDRQDAVEANFETNKEQAREQLLQQRVDEQYGAWVAEKQEEYEIKTSLFKE